MTKNLIIKTSYSRIPNGELKSNFGDLIRTTLLLNCIDENFLWCTDSRSKNLLKYFVEEDKIILLEEAKELKDLKFLNIYNIDNYVSDEELFKKIQGNWHGNIWNGTSLSPQNELIKEMAPYSFSKIEKSWQQLLIEGVGFEWKQQDYAKPKIDKEEFIDIGLNWHVHPEWTSKSWPKEYWEDLAQKLEKKYSVSWQEGLDNFDEYVKWMASCKLIITCETLGLHLASALRKKILAIIGPMENNEFDYGRITFIKPSFRNCMPCNSPKCKTGENCLNEIKSEKLVEVIENIIQKYTNL